MNTKDFTDFKEAVKSKKKRSFLIEVLCMTFYDHTGGGAGNMIIPKYFRAINIHF